MAIDNIIECLWDGFISEESPSSLIECLKTENTNAVHSYLLYVMIIVKQNLSTYPYFGEKNE